MTMTLERPTTVRPDVVQQSTRDAVDELYAGDTVAAFRAIDRATADPTENVREWELTAEQRQVYEAGYTVGFQMAAPELMAEVLELRAQLKQANHDADRYYAEMSRRTVRVRSDLRGAFPHPRRARLREPSGGGDRSHVPAVRRRACMSRDTRTMVTSDDDEWVLRSGALSRELQRAHARARPPHIQVHDAEQFRRDVLQHIDVLARLDVTDGERAETAEWRQRIEAAPAHRVWVEYQHPSAGEQGVRR